MERAQVITKEETMPPARQTECEAANPSPPGHDEPTLDPLDWESFRAQSHRMLDSILDYTQHLRLRPVWQPIPQAVRDRFCTAVPIEPTGLAEVHREFLNYILPYVAGNAHPGFMGWVQGGGTPVGMLAEMLAAGLNANAGGRDQIPIEVERQITAWMRQIFGFPKSASGLFVTGTSMANLLAVVIARDASLGFDARKCGVAAKSKRLTAYASVAVHGCIAKAMDFCGLGSDALHLVATDDRQRIDLAALEKEISKDRADGFQPFLVVASAGTVDTGAIDDLAGLAGLASREKIWLHVDGACGALAMLAPELAPKLNGIDRADSLAFDFHKWGQVPYDAGFILVRDGALHRKAFEATSAYLRHENRGLAAGTDWPCDYGPDLSRGFRALKTWFTLKVYGTEAIGAAIAQTCSLARYLEQSILEAKELELLAPVELNIVCYRYRTEDADRVNARIVVELQESGIVAPSTTSLDGRLAIRAAIVNHRTRQRDIDRLVEKTLEIGRKLTGGKGVAHRSPARADSVSPPPPRAKWESDLQEIELQLAVDPHSVDLRFRRASLLGELGRLADARNEYVKVLEREPLHKAAWNNLGGVLIATGHREAAQIAFREAVARYPDDPVCRVNLGNFLLEESEALLTRGQEEEALERKRGARQHFDHALRVQPDCEKAHEGLSYLLADLGEEESAALHRREAFRNRFIVPMPYRGAGAPITLLQLVSPLGGNVRWQPFLDDRIFRVIVVLPEFYNPATPLPAHELVINGIGDADVSPAALTAAMTVLAQTNAPVLNSPAAVLATARCENARRFAGLPGIVAPLMAALSREQLSSPHAAATLAELGFTFPLLLRAPGFHTGRHFLRVDTMDALPNALRQLPSAQLLVMQYLDARGSDGKSRKYRAMMIGGKLYPLHVAISHQWKVHYFTAEMADSAEHRAEDAAFLEDMPGVLGPRALRTLELIQSILGLDYAGIDFGLNARGEVLLFEANATMLVAPPGADERWSYRRPAYKRIRDAVQSMLLDKAGSRLHAAPN
jgi:aromatic-L-amino-acid/L-tryptophan decarboxylase